MTARILQFPHPRQTQGSDPARRGVLRGFARRLLGAFAAREQLQLERRYLVEMDDRTLRDIGVRRADVDSELRRVTAGAVLLLFRN